MLSRDSPRDRSTTTTTTSRHLGVENKISGLTGISSSWRKLGLFSSETSYRKVSAAPRTKVLASRTRKEIRSLFSSLLRVREPRQSPWAPGVATPRAARIGVNAVYAGNYTLDRSFHGCAARWNRKLDPKEETSAKRRSAGRYYVAVVIFQVTLVTCNM